MRLVNGGRRLVALTMMMLMVVPTGAIAHAPAPPHGCIAPSRPADEQNDALWQAFLDAVDEFRACVSGYAQANNEAADVHRAAANAATLEWNEFVRARLNVPQDFPWPPPERP